MIKDIFTGAALVARLETGSLGSHLKLLATTLQKQGYSTTTIGFHLHEAHAFGCWLSEKRQIDEISELTLEGYFADLSSQKATLTPQRRRRITTAIRLLLKHSRQSGLIAAPPAASLPLTEAQQWLIRYQEYLDKVNGLAPRTCQGRARFFWAMISWTMSRLKSASKNERCSGWRRRALSSSSVSVFG
jgi:hypothetical protein